MPANRPSKSAILSVVIGIAVFAASVGVFYTTLVWLLFQHAAG